MAPFWRMTPNSTVNQKRRPMHSSLSLSLRPAQTRPYSCRKSAKTGWACMGTWPKTSWKMSGSGGYSSESRLATPGRGGNLAGSEHLEEGVGRKEAADRSGVPAGARTEAPVDLGEVRNDVL